MNILIKDHQIGVDFWNSKRELFEKFYGAFYQFIFLKFRWTLVAMKQILLLGFLLLVVLGKKELNEVGARRVPKTVVSHD